MESFIGAVILNAGSVLPRGFLPCDGTLLPIARNQALFAVLGAKYGGDGITDFAVPKLTGPDGTTYLIATRGAGPK
jgi:microcystin-dependent protein